MLVSAFTIESSTITVVAGLVVFVKVVELFYNPAGILHQVREAMVMLTELDHEVKTPPRKIKNPEVYHSIMKNVKGKLLHVDYMNRLHPSGSSRGLGDSS